MVELSARASNQRPALKNGVQRVPTPDVVLEVPEASRDRATRRGEQAPQRAPGLVLAPLPPEANLRLLASGVSRLQGDRPARQPMSQNAVSSRVAATKVARSRGYRAAAPCASPSRSSIAMASRTTSR